MLRLRTASLVVVTLAACWLGMTALHELGHVLNAWFSGGKVRHMELPPRGLGHTRVSPNPHPRFVAWGGAVWGSLAGMLPLVFTARRELATWLARAFGGTCLIANGVYLGAGCFLGDANGADDAHELLRQGAAVWQLVLFGGLSSVAGIFLWHRLGPRAGLRRAAELASWPILAADAALVGLLLIVGWLWQA